jgi:hypothetical protein
LEFRKRLKDALSQAGYESSVTTMVGRARHGDDAFALKRLPVNSADDSDFFKAKLAGAYDWMAHVQSAIKRAKSVRGHNTANTAGSTEGSNTGQILARLDA